MVYYLNMETELQRKRRLQGKKRYRQSAKGKETIRKYRERTKEAIKRYNKEYYKRPEVIEKMKAYYVYREHVPRNKVARRIMSRIRKWINSSSFKDGKLPKSSGKTISLGDVLGVSSGRQFKDHFESLFQDGMRWDNKKEAQWQVGHKIPIREFDVLDEGELKKCFHYTNLQPEWAWENNARANERPRQTP